MTESTSVGILPAWDLLAGSLRAAVRPLHALVLAPSHFFLFTMALMLFRPPDIHFHSYDRFAFVLLIFVVVLRVCLRQEKLRFGGVIMWPMLGLLALAFYDSISQPYDPEIWSIFASKWAIPFALYFLAGYVFDDSSDWRRFEFFTLLALAYLSLIAILFLIDAKQFIFPRYILDEGLGIHADRARGPFLQAVANGVALNMLGLLALDCFRRKRLRGLWAVLVLAALPLAILATKTRAVWLSFAASIVLLLLSPNRRLRHVAFSLLIAGIIGLLAVTIFSDHHTSMADRLAERSPVEFRMAVYEAGAKMFLMKPLFGWGAREMQTELCARVSDFHQENFYFHNTYLEILVQYGLIGLAFYAWLVFCLFRVGRHRQEHVPPPRGFFLDEEFRSIWPVILLVYLLNGCFVVMNYQFVNGLLFAVAGMLAAQNQPQQEARYVRVR